MFDTTVSTPFIQTPNGSIKITAYLTVFEPKHYDGESPKKLHMGFHFPLPEGAGVSDTYIIDLVRDSLNKEGWITGATMLYYDHVELNIKDSDGEPIRVAAPANDRNTQPKTTTIAGPARR